MTGAWLFAAAVAAVALAAAPAAHAGDPAAPDPSREFSITGAGATFPFPLIDLWRVEYGKLHPNVNLNYQSIGSGGGVKQHIERTVNFAASDKPMSAAEAGLAPGTLHIPESLGGVVVAYNLPGVPEKGLRLTGEAISGIFLGEITRWNDPAIAAENPGTDLPDEEIVTVHRSDGSGTTFVFTDYLTAVSPAWDERVGKGKSVSWPSGIGAAGNEGVAGIVRSTEHSVGYIELAYAFQTGIAYASVQNAEGSAFIEPSLESISAASEGAAASLPEADESWEGVSIVNAPGAGSYPLSSFTYLLLHSDLAEATGDAEEARAVIHMIHWMITGGQQHAPGLLYVPLADPVAEIGKRGLAMAGFSGERLWEYEPAPPAIPDWVRNTALWWAEGAISDEEYVNSIRYLVSQGVIVLE